MQQCYIFDATTKEFAEGPFDISASAMSEIQEIASAAIESAIYSTFGLFLHFSTAVSISQATLLSLDPAPSTSNDDQIASGNEGLCCMSWMFKFVASFFMTLAVLTRLLHETNLIRDFYRFLSVGRYNFLLRCNASIQFSLNHNRL